MKEGLINILLLDQPKFEASEVPKWAADRDSEYISLSIRSPGYVDSDELIHKCTITSSSKPHPNAPAWRLQLNLVAKRLMWYLVCACTYTGITHSINPLVLAADKRRSTNLTKSPRIKDELKNISRRNVNQNIINDSPPNIL